MITKEVANYALDLLDVENMAWIITPEHPADDDRTFWRRLRLRIGHAAASISEDAGTLEDVYEPYLLKHGFIQRTPRGRVATDLAYAHLGIPHAEV